MLLIKLNIKLGHTERLFVGDNGQKFSFLSHWTSLKSCLTK